jgi:hypothetical protein
VRCCPPGAPLRGRHRLLWRRGLRYLRDQLFDECIAEGTEVLRDHDERAWAADVAAIRAGPSGRIAVALVEWSGILQQKIVIDWTVISNDETARQFGDRIMEAPRAFDKISTSISAGIDFAMAQLDLAPYEARRRVIDVSGDGDNNTGRDVTIARDEAVAKGITINGLVILTQTQTFSNPEHAREHTNPRTGGRGTSCANRFLIAFQRSKSFSIRAFDAHNTTHWGEA